MFVPSFNVIVSCRDPIRSGNSFRRPTIAQNIGEVVVNAAAMFTPLASECAGIGLPFCARELDLAWQPGYRSRFQYSDAEYFNLSDKDTGIATAQREQRAPTLEQIKHVIQTIPTRTEIDRRNRALIAFTLLTLRMEKRQKCRSLSPQLQRERS